MTTLFLDTLDSLSSELHSNAISVLTHPLRTSQKVESFSLHILEFKCSILSLLGTLKQPLPISALNQHLKKENEQLYRLRLHQILKRKINKQKRQSQLQGSILEDSVSLLQLEKSIIMVQKDLGIDTEEDNLTERLGLSTLISRSLIDSPHKEKLNQSTYSEMSSISHNTSILNTDKIPYSSQQTAQKVQSQPIASGIGQELLQKMQNGGLNTNIEKQTRKQTVLQKEPKKGLAVKKTKKVVYSKDNKQEGLLDNLLEETLLHCSESKTN